VLQTPGYIKFAREHSVDIMALSHWEQALKEGHRVATFKAKDDVGDEVEYLLLYPTLRPSDLPKLYTAKTVSFNKTGIMPYTAIVDPHTEEEMVGLTRGRCSGRSIMDAVTAAKKKLNQKYGPSVRRDTIEKIRKKQDAILDLALDGKLDRAVPAYRRLERETAREPDAVRKLVATSWTAIVDEAGKALDTVAELLEKGANAEALRILRPLARPFAGTELEGRIRALVRRAGGR
jgi:hypothetical protein